MLEIIAGDIIVKVPNTPEGIAVFKATLKLLKAVFAEEEKHTEKEREQHKEEPQEISGTAFFSPPMSSPKQRIKFKGWEPVAKTRIGIIYKEVINRMLEEYTEDGIEPTTEILSQAIQEMHGKELKVNTLASYVSVYRRYIKEYKLAVKPPIKKQKENNLYIPEEGESTVKHSTKETNSKELLPIEKVAEIWDLLPDEFEYKKVKSRVPVHISQSFPRIDTTNFIIKQFLNHPLFACEETTPGSFKKKELGDLDGV